MKKDKQELELESLNKLMKDLEKRGRETRLIAFKIDTQADLKEIQKQVTKILLSLEKKFFISSYEVRVGLLRVEVIKK